MTTKEIALPPEYALEEGKLLSKIREHHGLTEADSLTPHIIKRSIDARSRSVVVRVQYELIARESEGTNKYSFHYDNVSNREPVIIVGSGPAGLFAALRLIELGYRPMVIERGKDVRARRRDLAAISKDHIVNPDSNYCFGEGGAGTYSDGKLYTRSNKRGDVDRILALLIAHGAHPEIRYDAHPHIGTNKLPPLIASIRNTIIEFGGTIHFEQRVTDLIIKDDSICGVITNRGDRIEGIATVLATGHSARDIYELLASKGIEIESKPFALGVRVEHQQELIDRIQYHCATDRGPYLPASSYSLVHQAKVHNAQRGVFSFCMCPGGFIVPAATAPGEVVVNGMSPSRRDSKFANSGIVVAVDEKDFVAFQSKGVLAGMYFQAAIEQAACSAAGGKQSAPGQRLVDFVEGRDSPSLLPTSYQPGLVSVDLRQVLPKNIAQALQQGFKSFGAKMKGYLTNEAQVVAVESRTSSPIRIPRDKDTLQHVRIKGLFPCGEGAGYAGGIVSAAMDGERCAEALVRMKELKE